MLLSQLSDLRERWKPSTYSNSFPAKDHFYALLCSFSDVAMSILEQKAQRWKQQCSHLCSTQRQDYTCRFTGYSPCQSPSVHSRNFLHIILVKTSIKKVTHFNNSYFKLVLFSHFLESLFSIGGIPYS